MVLCRSLPDLSGGEQDIVGTGRRRASHRWIWAKESQTWLDLSRGGPNGAKSEQRRPYRHQIWVDSALIWRVSWSSCVAWVLKEETYHLTCRSRFLRVEAQHPPLKESDLAIMGRFQLVCWVAWTTLIYSDMEMILSYSLFFFWKS